MAKLHHPDLNPTIPANTSQTKMAEIIQAYQQLMDHDNDLFGGTKVGDSRVALACEIFTLDELNEDLIHDVHAIRILYVSDTTVKRKSNIENEEMSSVREVSIQSIMEVAAHPEDSISDVKRELQIMRQEEWGLKGRRLDRDQIATGWELVCSGGKYPMLKEEDEIDRSIGKKDNNTSLHVMSYHLFLQSYGVQHGDIIHAVVRRQQ